MKKVIVFGSLNMDLTIECDQLPQAGQTVEGHGFFTNPGGKGGNQAAAAAKMGAPTYMIARVGEDFFGEEILRALTGAGVDCRYVDKSARGGTGVAVITRSGGDNRIILSRGANHEITGAEVEAALESLGGPLDVFVTQYECSALAVTDALAAAKRRGLFTIFNPAPAKAIPPETYPDIDLLVVNQTECAFLTGIYPTDRESCQTALGRFKALGAGGAIITLGAAGSVCRMGGELIRVESYSVPNVDTTAAGDAYIGAMASSLVRGENLEQGMRLATKTAALTITRQGAQQSIPTLDEVEAYFREEKGSRENQ